MMEKVMGVMMQRRNRNRGYQQLRVWQDAVELYRLTCQAVRGWPFDRKKVAGQAIASCDSIHRNIAEGYCRRSVREHLQFLNIALGSLGECVSGYLKYHRAKQLSDNEFESPDALSFRLENGLMKLIESLERKRDSGDWRDSFAQETDKEN
jgi:four helix bundle protein